MAQAELTAISSLGSAAISYPGANLGKLTAAVENYRKALHLRAGLMAKPPANRELRREWIGLEQKLLLLMFLQPGLGKELAAERANVFRDVEPPGADGSGGRKRWTTLSSRRTSSPFI